MCILFNVSENLLISKYFGIQLIPATVAVQNLSGPIEGEIKAIQLVPLDLHLCKVVYL